MYKVIIKDTDFNKNLFIDRISLIFLPKFRQLYLLSELLLS